MLPEAASRLLPSRRTVVVPNARNEEVCILFMRAQKRRAAAAPQPAAVNLFPLRAGQAVLGIVEIRALERGLAESGKELGGRDDGGSRTGHERYNGCRGIADDRGMQPTDHTSRPRLLEAHRADVVREHDFTKLSGRAPRRGPRLRQTRAPRPVIRLYTTRITAMTSSRWMRLPPM